MGITGRLHSAEENLPATADMRIIIPQRVKAMIAGGEAPYPVVKVTDYDGTKVYFEHDNWALLRFSGTEPVLRIFAEADSPDKARELVEWLKQYAQAA